MTYAIELSEALAQCLEAQAADHAPEDAELLRVIDLSSEQLTDRLFEMGECRRMASAAIKRALSG